MKRKFLSLTMSLLFFLPSTVSAQNARLTGRIVENKNNSPLFSVDLRLTAVNDTSEVHQTTSRADGSFAFHSLRMQSYRLDATHIGYQKLTRTVQIDKAEVNLGDLKMVERVIQLGEFLVKGRLPTAMQVGDTTVYNALSFKTNPDAAAEDLLAKMPGIVVENGSIKAEGEEVQQVLVDGKPFFGRDPMLALRNLPADVVEKIQVYDKMSDQAEFTGFDDGQSIKTINIITRMNRRNSQFGKVSGGYGKDDRYLAGGGMNFFSGARRVSVIGLSNNVNQQNFSMQDLLGVVGNTDRPGGFGGGGFGGGGFGGGGFGARGGGGGGQGGGRRAGPPGGGMMSGSFSPGPGANVGNFLVGQQNGINSVHSLGTNYGDAWGEHLEVNGSYFFNLTQNKNPRTLNTEYFLSADSSTYYNENSSAESKNFNHRTSFRFQYSIDSANSLIVTPQLSLQDNNSSRSFAGLNSISTTALLNQTDNNTRASTSGYNMSTNVVFRHRFHTPGRTISVDLGVSANKRDRTSNLQSLVTYFTLPAGLNETLDQRAGGLSKGFSISSRLVYTEPLGTNSLLQIQYFPSVTKSSAENNTFNYDTATGGYSKLNQRLSNTSENTYTAQRAGIGYRTRVEGLNLMTEISYQIGGLRNDQSFPFSKTIERKFFNLLPSMMLNYDMGGHTNLRVFYRTSTNPPSIGQLQDVIDNSNPVLLSTGNPNLKQAYSHSLVTRYSVTDIEQAQNYFFLLSLGFTQDYIGTSTMIAEQDTVLSSGTRLNKGTQLTTPVNLAGHWNARAFYTFSRPIDFLKSNLNLNTGLSYTRTPGLINSIQNNSRTIGISQGFVLGSNVSENVDFTVSYSATYNIVRNTLQPELQNNYFYHTAGLKFNWIFWEGLVFRSDVGNTLYTGLTGGYNQSYVLCNLGLGKKLLENDRGELRLSVTDLLNQNRNVNRTVTETYVEDTRNQVLGRFIMLTFTYTLR